MKKPMEFQSESAIRTFTDMYIIPNRLNRIRDEWAALLSKSCLKSIAWLYNHSFSELGPGSYPEGAVTHFSLEDFQLSPYYQLDNGAEVMYAKVTPPGDKSGQFCAAYAVVYNSRKEYHVFSLISQSGSEDLDVYTIDLFGGFNNVGVIPSGRSWVPILLDLAEKPMEVCTSERMEYEEDGFHCIATWIPSAGITYIERYDETGKCVDTRTVEGKPFPFFSSRGIRFQVGPSSSRPTSSMLTCIESRDTKSFSRTKSAMKYPGESNRKHAPSFSAPPIISKNYNRYITSEALFFEQSLPGC